MVPARGASVGVCDEGGDSRFLAPLGMTNSRKTADLRHGCFAVWGADATAGSHVIPTRLRHSAVAAYHAAFVIDAMSLT